MSQITLVGTPWHGTCRTVAPLYVHVNEGLKTHSAPQWLGGTFKLSLGCLGRAFRVPWRLGDAFIESLGGWKCFFKKKINNLILFRMQHFLRAKEPWLRNESEEGKSILSNCQDTLSTLQSNIQTEKNNKEESLVEVPFLNRRHCTS